MTGSGTGARWDWYQATIRAPAEQVEADLLTWFGSSWVEEAQARLGFGRGYTVRDRNGRRAAVQDGGRNVWPNVTGSGEDAPAVADFLRAVYPEHEVTRFDSCVDTDGTGSGAWGSITSALLSVVEQPRSGPEVKVSMHGDWREGRGEDGRTLYLGATSSAVRIRAYEKGKQLRSTGAERPERVPLDAVRVEVQVRPSGQARKRAARVDPMDAWRFSRLAADVAGRLFDAGDLSTIRVRDVRASDDDRALRFMIEQYGAMLERQAQYRGGFAALWRTIERRLGVAPGGAEPQF